MECCGITFFFKNTLHSCSTLNYADEEKEKEKEKDEEEEASEQEKRNGDREQQQQQRYHTSLPTTTKRRESVQPPHKRTIWRRGSAGPRTIYRNVNEMTTDQCS
jgi:hypothetical protein